MDLKTFDGKCVRITTASGEVYEGIVSHCGREYVFHEYGQDQEALLLVPILFYADDIANVVSLEDVDGPFGHFSERYGLLEKKCLAWGTDLMEEVFDSEDDTQILRLLACMDDHLQSLMDRAVCGMAPWRLKSTSNSEETEAELGPIYRGELENMLKTLIRYSKNDAVVAAAKAFWARFTEGGF